MITLHIAHSGVDLVKETGALFELLCSGKWSSRTLENNHRHSTHTSASVHSAVLRVQAAVTLIRHLKCILAETY